MPTIENEPTENATPAIGFLKPLPRRLRKSVFQPDSWIRPEVDRKSIDLAMPWTKMWKTAATMPASVPIPMPI